MFFSPWFIVPVALFVTLIILFAALMIWLAHTLDGYPMFLMQNRERDIEVVPRSLGDRSEPESFSVVTTFTDMSQVRAASRHGQRQVTMWRASDAERLWAPPE
jgi:hypothetical protein